MKIRYRRLTQSGKFRIGTGSDGRTGGVAGNTAPAAKDLKLW
jgi:hypothetical protein